MAETIPAPWGAFFSGDIVLELDEEKAPGIVANFVQYAKEGHYDGTIFHRVINNFMMVTMQMAELTNSPLVRICSKIEVNSYFYL